SARERERYYEGFSNDTLWPLYHDAIRDSGFQVDDWSAYVDVNQRFAVRIANIAPPDAVVWLHDYHLQLVPALVREQRSDLRIGWFNHIPWPPVELFQRLPWRSEIIAGLLGSDLLGFQRERAAQNFITAAQQLTGATEVEHGVLEHEGRRNAAGRFPTARPRPGSGPATRGCPRSGPAGSPTRRAAAAACGRSDSCSARAGSPPRATSSARSRGGAASVPSCTRRNAARSNSASA